jgi:cation diffusion facilitator CzcD-associated flavoprotein CzcO
MRHHNGGSPETTPSHVEVAIIGAGFSGLGMAMALKQDAVGEFVVLERAGELGGTWRDNSYPGCACDIPSVLYSWSDEQNPEWSRLFAPQPEIWDYMKTVVARHDIDSHLRFNSDVRHVQWDDELARWEIETSQGALTADVVVSGAGALADPKIPNLPGLERFEGKVFHSARWDHEHDLEGREVAVVGTGASAIQFVPRIQPKVGRLHLFQRTPPWVLPRAEPEISLGWRRRLARHPRLMHAVRWATFSLLEAFHFAFRHPWLMRVSERRARSMIHRQVSDPELREKLIPDYRMGCKRVLGSDNWYPAICADNVDVVTGGVREVTAGGIVDEQGVEHRVDTIIFGTGFEATDPPIADRVVGRYRKTLAQTWQGSPKAHLGVCVSGFPNLFFLLGPNTGLGHNSVLLMVEAQTAYVRQALAYRRRHGAATIEPRPDAQTRFLGEIDEGTKGSVWTAGGCASWYLDSTGRNSTLWPWSVRAYRRRLARFDPSEHQVTQPRPARVLAPSETCERIRNVCIDVAGGR